MEFILKVAVWEGVKPKGFSSKRREMWGCTKVVGRSPERRLTGWVKDLDNKVCEEVCR
jgi:hypothetical protein